MREDQSFSRRFSVSKLTLHKPDGLEWAAIILSLWFFIYPRPYIPLLTILLLLPLVGIFINGWNKPSLATLVDVSEGRNGKDRYDVADFIDFPAWAILFRLLLDYKFESYYSMIIPGTVAAVMMLVILLLTHRLITHSRHSKTWIYLSIFFNVTVYSYAATYTINCAYDRSQAQVYPVEVTSKRTYRGRRGSTYYLTIMPWGHHDKEEVRVPGSLYNVTDTGDDVDIELRKGLFHIQWYAVKRNHLRYTDE